MFIKPYKKLNKRGFTLAESVLALAVIAITSVGTISLILSAQNATISAAQKQQAQLYAADIIACYRADGDFNDNVQFALAIGDFNLDKDIPLDGDLYLHAIETPGENNAFTITVKVHTGNIEKPLVTQEFTKYPSQGETQ